LLIELSFQFGQVLCFKGTGAFMNAQNDPHRDRDENGFYDYKSDNERLRKRAPSAGESSYNKKKRNCLHQYLYPDKRPNKIERDKNAV
jgi:hypothetical protein